MSRTDSIRTLRSRTWGELFLLPEALCLLGMMRLSVVLVPFQRTADFLGLQQDNAATVFPDARQASVAASVGWAVRAIACRTPWESACLTQALAGMVMLQRRGVPARLLLGVAKDIACRGEMNAHAWLTCGDAILTGEGGYERFTVIATFSGRRPS